MSDASSRKGIPVWREIITTEGGKATEFYRQLAGWDIHETDMGPAGTYTMFRLGDKSLGGVLNQAEGAPRWITYFTVDDVDAAAGRAKAAGGKVILAPRDIPQVGRFCMVQDPQGGISCPFKGSADMAPPADAGMGPGEFCWEEFLAADAQKAVDFYRELYGWGHETMPMAGEGIYHILKAGERGVAGIMQMPAEAGADPHWIPYLLVEDVDATTKKASELGARVHVEPRDIPDMGRFAVIGDPVGASFAFYRGSGQ